MKALALTLGHNSSAVLIQDGRVVAGYEEERLNGIKSSSVFPEKAITRLMDFGVPEDVKVCVSHWFLDGKLPESNKYWRPEFILKNFPKCEILAVDDAFTHHDAHAVSARVFAGNDFPSHHHIMVIDGFGTLGECYSIYKVDEGKMSLTCRVHGFPYSVGLFYQYATAYCGMTMHQHEYKMLAYETHMEELVPCPFRMRDIDFYIDTFSAFHTWSESHIYESQLDSLASTQAKVNLYLDLFLSFVECNKLILGKIDNRRTKRILVSYFTQRYVENIIKDLCNRIHPTNLIVVGGTFYNVKINSMLCDMIPGKFCAMPLAGDQGAGLGIYQLYFNDLIWPGHLNWGIRPEFDLDHCMEDNLRRGDIEDVEKSLLRDGLVNIIGPSMEFGPRALCNTSTLALPTPANAELINQMNNRTNEMPFALVVTKEQADELFMDVNKIHRSLEYMIVTRRFKAGCAKDYLGGAHYYPFADEYTCRPQITYDPFMIQLLNKFGPLINTSFNYHGQPIVYDQAQITYAHTKENKTFKVSTIIL